MTMIAIDGVDSSGKQTHTEMLYKRLAEEKINVRKISFPMYENQSSYLVRQYLSGAFGDKPEDVNAYAASTFFAADRFATYKSDWGRDYNSGTVIIADRYIASNMIHQASKIDDEKERNRFLDWEYDLEYNIYKLPKPDLQIFLDMPVEFAEKLMAERANKITGEKKKDIHESNHRYLQKSYDNAVYVAKKYGWVTVKCVKNGKIRSFQEINDDIYNYVKQIL